MYGFKKSGIISNLELQKNMEKFGHCPVRFTAGIWKHETNETIFTLVVNNFCIKYTSEVNAEHLLHALRKNTLSQLIKRLKNISALV